MNIAHLISYYRMQYLPDVGKFQFFLLQQLGVTQCNDLYFLNQTLCRINVTLIQIYEGKNNRTFIKQDIIRLGLVLKSIANYDK